VTAGRWTCGCAGSGRGLPSDGLQSRVQITLTAAALALGVAPASPAVAATTTPQSAALALVHKLDEAKTRTGLGLPSLRAVLGRKRAAVKPVSAAERRMAADMSKNLSVHPLAARVATRLSAEQGRLWGTDLGADLGLRRDRFDTAKQHFLLKLRVDPCPDPGVPADLYGTLHGDIDARHSTVTEQRIGGYVFKTITLFSIRGDFGMSTNSNGNLRDGVKFGNLVVVIERARQVRRVRGGRVVASSDASGELSFDPITGVIGAPADAFAGFVAEQESEERGDPPGSTPPLDRLSSRSYNSVANRLMTTIEQHVAAAGKSAAPHWLTPNTCVALDLEHPPTAVPGETGVVIKGRPKAGPSASLILTELEYLGGTFSHSSIGGEPANGLAASSPSAYPLKPGDIWYLADMPSQAWTATNAPALKVTFTSKGGTAQATASFAPATSDSFDVAINGSDNLVWDSSYIQHPNGCDVSYVQKGTRTFTFRSEGQSPNGIISKTSNEGEPFRFVGAAYPPSTVQQDGQGEVHYTQTGVNPCNPDTYADTSGCTHGATVELTYGLNVDLRWSDGVLSAVFSIPSGNYSQLNPCPHGGDGPDFGDAIITAEAALTQAEIEDKTKSVITLQGARSDNGPKSTHEIHWTMTLRRK
jgi:hypothetical protein